MVDRSQNIHSTVAVLNVSNVNEDEDQEAAGIGQDMMLSNLHLLARVPGMRRATSR